jgi:hypothetical protein
MPDNSHLHRPNLLAFEILRLRPLRPPPLSLAARHAGLLSSEGKEAAAMVVVVEIASPKGTRAFKEYDAPSMGAAVCAADMELQRYPGFEVVDVWIKGEHGRYGDLSDEW